MKQPDLPPFSHSTPEMNEMLKAKIKDGKPSFFKIKGQLPSQGRTDTPLAATDKMTVVLKAYASGGENELHAHPFEDHVFMVLQGAACFFGPDGEERTIGKYEGINLPHGTYYWFKAVGDEQLVMVRVGCAAFGDKPRQGRIDLEGNPIGGFSQENKEVPVILSGKVFG